MYRSRRAKVSRNSCHRLWGQIQARTHCSNPSHQAMARGVPGCRRALLPPRRITNHQPAADVGVWKSKFPHICGHDPYRRRRVRKVTLRPRRRGELVRDDTHTIASSLLFCSLQPAGGQRRNGDPKRGARTANRCGISTFANMVQPSRVFLSMLSLCGVVSCCCVVSCTAWFVETRHRHRAAHVDQNSKGMPHQGT